MVRGEFTLLFYVALLGFFAGALFLGVGFSDVGGGSSGVSAGSRVMYLYPAKCVDCGNRVPPTCGECITFYSDSVVLDAVSADVGVPLELFVSAGVSEPTLLIASNGVVSLGDARTKFSIAGNLCTMLGVEQSCSAFSDRLFSVQKCFESANVSKSTLVYQYSESCSHCEKVSESLDKLLQLDYYGRPYQAVSINSANENELSVLRSCAGDIVNTRFVPNVLCPANGRFLNGEVSFSVLRDFADECIEAAGD